jgi:hypothetical protein
MSGKRSSFVWAKTEPQASNKKATGVAVIRRRAKTFRLNKGNPPLGHPKKWKQLYLNGIRTGRQAQKSRNTSYATDWRRVSKIRLALTT